MASDQIELMDEDLGFDALRDAERDASDAARQRRAHRRMAFKAKIILQPGNSSEFLSFKVQGITGDISTGGCRAMFPVPIQIGDVYRLHFAQDCLDLPMLFARCLHCRLINEDAYEAGFSFFSPITLPQSICENVASAPS